MKRFAQRSLASSQASASVRRAFFRNGAVGAAFQRSTFLAGACPPGARALMSKPKSDQQSTWITTMFAGLYTRVARPQPDLHLHELALKANIPIQTVQHMWKRFVEIDVSRDSGDGLTGDRRIALEELEPLLAEAGIQDKVLRKALFDAFDADRCGTIDFREFVSGLALINSGAKEDREVLIFCLFDLDGSRVISRKEMMDTFKMLVQSNQRLAHRGMSSDQPISVNERTEVLAESMTNEIFEDCDLDNNGVLDLDEFRAWLKSDCATAQMVTEWFEDFSASYSTAVSDNQNMEGMSKANKEWLTSARARSWHERASETGLYTRTDTVLAPGKCTSEPR